MPVHDIVRQRLQPLTAAVTSHRIFLYSVFSTFAVVGTVANACRNYSNFYSVAIYLSKSSRSVLVLANYGFLLALHFGRVLQRLFFGPLQPREVERLYDQTWIFVTESLLAFTIFRDDFDIPFVLMFGFLLFVKCFHWLMADRVETMDQTTYPGPPLLFHMRMLLLFCLLWTIDVAMFALAVESTLTHGVGGMVLFASEYAILMASALNSVARYILSVIDFRRARTRGGENAPPMENKSMYVFYIELVTDFLKLATYLTFFMLILTFYGLPLNIVRDVYLTARSFITRLRALVRYHTATRDMDRRYPNATEAELSEMSDRTCIICREEMVSRIPEAPTGAETAEAPAPQPHDGPNMTPKKLPCGHIFHFQCLRSWLERQQSCPTCRRTVLETTPPNQAQTQNRPGGAGPPAPQPGAIPQAGQQPAGAAGWLGRFLGIAQQPPVMQGQFMNGQFGPGGVPQQPPPPNMGWAPGPQAPPYYYPVHYPQPAQQPQLQQPPLFRGFYGPGGVWQPWGVDPQWFGHNPRPQDQAPTAQHQASQRPPAPAVTAESSRRPGPPPHAPPTPTVATSSPTSEHPPTPREAAALAALRRSNSSQPETPMRNPPSFDRNASPGTANVPSDASKTASASPVLPGPPPTTTGPSASSSNSDTRPQLPSLIPLYELSSSGQALRLPQPFTSPPNVSNAQHGSFFRGAAPTSRTPQSQPQPGGPRPATSQTQHLPSRGLRPGVPTTARTPLDRLPATLTDEQLARLDRVTREAIEERLRVLEGVSGAVYRCIEELTRVRSVLPVPAGLTPTPSQVQPQGQVRTPVNVSSGNVAAGPSMLRDATPSASMSPTTAAGSVAAAPLVSGASQDAVSEAQQELAFSANVPPEDGLTNADG